MGGSLQELIATYRDKGVLVDANLLLVALLGACDPGAIETFTRTKGRYTAEDYETINLFLDLFSHKVTTPNILNEVSDLAGKLRADIRPDFFRELAQFAAIADERYYPSREGVALHLLDVFGLTDLTIAAVAGGRFLVLTDDLRVASYLLSSQMDVINFYNIRELNW